MKSYGLLNYFLRKVKLVTFVVLCFGFQASANNDDPAMGVFGVSGNYDKLLTQLGIMGRPSNQAINR